MNDRMVMAVARMYGWACPNCKRMVKSPALWLRAPFAEFETAEGKCSFCKSELIFQRYPLSVKKSGVEKIDAMIEKEKELKRNIEIRFQEGKKEEKLKLDIEEGPIGTGIQKALTPEEAFEKYFLDQGYVRHIFPKLTEEARPIVVDFLNESKMLKWFEKYADEKGLFLSEVITGFAAKGLLKYMREEKK